MMELKLERTEERLTRRTGLVLVNRFGNKIDLANKIDRAFGRAGSNRGMAASESAYRRQVCVNLGGDADRRCNASGGCKRFREG